MSIKKDIFAPLASGLGATRRAAMLLLVMLLTMTAQTAWAKFSTTYPFKPTITYDGVNASDVTFSLTGGGVTDQALSNGQNFNVSIDDDPVYPASFTITCSNPNGLDLQVNYSGKVYYMLYSQSNITFTTNDCYGSTFNVYHNDLAEGNQYIAVTITVSANTSHDVNLPTGLTGGSITSNKSNPVTTAETVTLTAVPGSGYLPTSISATRHNGGAAVGVDWDGSFDNTATFAMPGDAVDVSASFTNVWTAAGGLVAKIPKNNATRSVTIPSGVTSFKVYGPSGSSAKTSYVNLEQGELLLTAPDGCIIKLTGDILANGLFNIYVYDGNSISSAKIGYDFGNTSGNEALPDNVVSTGNTMLIITKSRMDGLSAGLDLTATVINTSAASTVTINPAQEGGTVTADKTPAEYCFGETVTLSVTPDAGYLLGAISVTDESGNAVNVVGSSFTNSLTFTMPATNVTVTPTFTTTWTADGGLFANMPATGSATVTIPSGVQSFKVYDDGGLNRVFSPNCNGILTLTAPDGCKIRLMGDIYSESGNVLSVYDGANISGTVLLNKFYHSSSYGSIGTHVSTGESMTLKFVTDAHENRDGLRLISTVLYPVSVASSIEHGTVTADKDHAAAGETVTLDHHREGYVFLGYTATGVTLSGSATSFTMPANDVTIGAEWADPADISVNAADTEYTIHTAEGWGVFCDLLADNDKGIFSGKTVVLGNDITVTRMAGGSGQEFTGTFNGNGKTLTVDYANTDNNVRTAPFSYVDGATIQNLIVGGTISGTAHHAAGIIGETGNTTSHITNCVSNVDISSGRYTGGFSIGGNVEIEGCVFNGKINGTDKSGGFIGYSNSAQVIKNSLFAPQDGSNISGGTFYYNGGSDVAPVNSYCTQALGTAQGKACHSVTAGENVTINAIALTGDATNYTVSGITAYSGGGLKRGNVKYYGSGDQVSLTLSNSSGDAPDGYQYGGYTASAGTLSGTENPYMLTMPDQDVTINATLQKLMTNNDITVTIPSQEWTGNELTPVIIVKDGETVLTENTDYTVTPPSGTIQDAGDYTYTITGMGNYAGSREAMFTITPDLAGLFGAVYVYQDQNGKTALLDGTSEDQVYIPSFPNITVNHVTSNRTFTPGKASTVMLPFDYTCNGQEGGTFYKFVGVEKENDNWVATMKATGDDANNQGTLTRNTPYLFMPTATGMSFPNINGSVTLSTEGGGNCETAAPGSHWTFKGTYEYMKWTDDTNDQDYNAKRAEEIDRAYGFAGVDKAGIFVGDFVRVASGAKIRPMRAYLIWNDIPNMPNFARSFTRGAAAADEELPQRITVRLVGSNGETHGIGEIDTKTGEIDFSGWYDMSGHKLSGKPTKKGLYINNGHKVVIK